MSRIPASAEKRKPDPALSGKCATHGQWVNVLETGAIADGSAVSTASIQRAIDLCSQRGGGTVFIPAGKYVSGTLWMHSNITLHLDSGAVLFGDSEPSRVSPLDHQMGGKRRHHLPRPPYRW